MNIKLPDAATFPGSAYLYAMQARFLSAFLWLVFAAALILLVDPRGDFPLNDDWQYAYPVRALVASGRFEMMGQFAPSVVLQVGWGYLACLVFGSFSFTWLRLSTLALAALAVWLAHRWTRQLTGSTVSANLMAAALLLNPLFFNLSFSFMTDVPFLALVLLSLWLFWQYVEYEASFALAGAVLAAAAAFFIRQPGLLLLPAYGVFLLIRSRGIRRTIFRPALLFLAAAGLYFLWENAVKPGLGIEANYVPVGGRYLEAVAGQPVSFALDIIRRAVRSFLYLGFFALPLIPFLWRRLCRKGLFRPAFTVPIGLLNLLLFLFLIKIGKTFPFGGNIFYNFGLGPELLADVYTFGLPNTPRLPEAVMLILQVLSQLSASWLALLLIRGYRDFTPSHRRLLGLLLLFNLLYIPLMSITSYFDRYLLPVIASLFIGLSPLLSFPRRWPSFIPLLLFGLFSIAGTHDYLAWNRARAEAFDFLQEKGIGIKEMDAGYEYNGWHNYRADYQHREDRSYWWVDDDRYLITFGPVPGYRPVQQIFYPRRLFFTVDSLWILEKAEKPPE